MTVIPCWQPRTSTPIARPHDIRYADNLPKIRSGKIIRRLLRSIAAGEPITQDTSTLENEAILLQLQGKAWLLMQLIKSFMAGEFYL